MTFADRMRAAGAASSIHFLLSCLVAVVASAVVFLVWYPYPYRDISGGRELFLLIIAVSCLHIDSIGMDIIKKGVIYDATSGAVKSCLFCKIATREEPGTIIFEDSKFVVFKTINPASNKHLLVTPKKHIQNLEALKGPADAALVREMIKVGVAALGDQAEGAHYSFHVPPFNSIDHLHMHAIGTQIDVMPLFSNS